MHRPAPARRNLAAVVAAAAVLVVGGSTLPAAATQPKATPSPPPEAVLTQRVNAHDEHIRLAMPEGAVIRDFTLTYEPGDDSEWHEHPGVVLATVVSGSVYRWLPCQVPQRFSAGQAFVEVGPHRVQNPGTTKAVLSITQIAPPGTSGMEFRTNVPAPDCRSHRR